MDNQQLLDTFPDIQHSLIRHRATTYTPGTLLSYACGGSMQYGILKKYTDRSVQFIYVNKWVYGTLLKGKNPSVSYINVSDEQIKWRIAPVNLDLIDEESKQAYNLILELLYQNGILK
jgi:hypothetical protein